MYLTIDGMKTHYTQEGEGDYVFLLHGWGSNLTLFQGLSGVLAEKYTAVSVDLPGFGQSDEPHEAWDVSAYTEFVISFIQHFACDRVILLGHSFGGRIIIKMASRPALPFQLDKIILVDSAGILPKRTAAYQIRLKAYKLGKGLLNFGPVKKLFPRALDGYKKKMGSADYSNASEVMRQCLVKAVNEDLTPLLGNIRASTLLIWGENDDATPVADGKLMEQTIPDAGLVVLQNAGHYSFLDQAFTFHRVIKSFLMIGD